MFQLKKRNVLSSTMESGDHLKNGASSKSLTSRRNFKAMLCTVFAFMAILLTFNSCGKDEDSNEENEPEKTNLSLSTSDIEFEANDDATKTVTIYTNMDADELRVSSSTSWCNVKLEYKTLSISVKENTATQARSTTITISGNGFSESLKVTQAGLSLPKVPTGVEANANATSVMITWDSVPGATNYAVYRSSSENGNYSQIKNVMETSVVDNSPLDGVNYYKVSAFNAAGETEKSASATCTFQKNTTPSTPTGVSVKYQNSNLVVSWNAVSGATRYYVWYKRPIMNGTDYSQDYVLINAPTTSTNFSWSTMYTGTYTFWVEAANDKYEKSPASNKVTYTLTNSGSSGGNQGGNQGSETPKKLDTPTGLEATSGSSFVQISFNTVSLAYQYELYRATSASGSYTKISATGGSNASGTTYTLTDSNPRNGTSYYKVKAIPLSSMTYLTSSDLSDYVSVTRK